MASQKLRRTAYQDLFNPANPTIRADEDPVLDGSNTATGDHTERDLTEPYVDQEEFVRPLEEVHGSGPHEWGVALGLSVSWNGTKLMTSQGIAIDADGRHISLAVGGEAETDPNPPSLPNNAPTPKTPQPVGANGVNFAIPPSLAKGDYVFTISYRDVYAPAGNSFTWTHMPWLRLVPAATCSPTGADGVPLALVSLGGDRIPSSLSDSWRRETVIPAGALRVYASQVRQSGLTTTVRDVENGHVRGIADGAAAGQRGLEIVVPDAANQIRLTQRTQGQVGSPSTEAAFKELAIRAHDVNVRNDAGNATVNLNSDLGNVVAGGNGVEGDLIAVDGQGNLMVVADAADARVIAGGKNKAGTFRVLDKNKNEVVRIGGDSGDLVYAGALRDLLHSNLPPIPHSLLQFLFPLTNGSTTTLHRHPFFVGGRVVSSVFGSTAVFTVFVTGLVVAFTAISDLGLAYGGSVSADIIAIDGKAVLTQLFIGPVATSVTFSVSTGGFATVNAIGVVIRG
jgi:hypothetical protein